MSSTPQAPRSGPSFRHSKESWNGIKLSVSFPIACQKAVSSEERKMADGEHSLPANDQLFEQQPTEEQAMDLERMQQSQDIAHQEQEQIPGLDFINARHEPPRNYHPPHHFFEPSHREEPPMIIPVQTNVFQPAHYDPEAYEEYTGDGDGRDGVQEQDQNEHVVWIDSDSENDTEEAILKANFGLPYSDHNYDCADSTERVIHPQEGPFPVLGPLDEEGKIVSQWLPEGCVPMRPLTDDSPTSTPPMSPLPHQTQPLQQQQLPPQQQQQQPLHHQQHVPGGRVAMQGARPMGVPQPFSMGGNQIEFQRGDVIARSRGEHGQYRLVSSTEYGNGMIASRAGAGIGSRISGAIIRTARGEGNTIYHQQPQPIGAVRTPAQMPHRRPIPLHQQQSTPGSYAHIAHPTPGGGTILRRPAMGRAPGAPGHRPIPILGRNQIAMSRPAGEDREFVGEQPHVLQPQGQTILTAVPPMPAQRRIADMAPHRMTQEQRQEQQQLVRGRPAPQFSTIEQGQSPIRQGPGRLLVRGPGTTGAPQAGAGVLVRGRGGAPGAEDVSRSPQKVMEQSPQQPELDQSPQAQQEPPQPPQQARKFQVKVTDSYSAPIQKASDQLPAQLTEDPPEEEPTTSQAPVLTPSAAPVAEQPVAEQSETAPTVPQPAGEMAQEGITASPTKTLSKPTPPHRFTHEERSAHFAKLSGEKIMHPLSPPRISHNLPSSSTSSHIPMRPVGHQDDTLAMVQSVFESKPRLADTPKDMEAISKIADHLRFSAQKYETGNNLPESARRRNDSGMSGGHHHLHHHPYHQDVVDEGRRRNRYEMPSSQQQPHPLHGSSALGRPALSQQIPPQLQQSLQGPLDPTNRPRGRPKGSAGPVPSGQRTRYPDGQEAPIPPHRTGGARTLPPRQAAVAAAAASAPPTNRRGPHSSNSDSESEGVEQEDWVMRCHCGMDHGDGFSVECEKCKTWQHGYCMSLQPDDEKSLKNYMCELCRPRRLQITKADAVRIQKRELAKLRKATEAENKARKNRRSEQAEQKKGQSSNSRKSAPALTSYQQQQQLLLQQQHELANQAPPIPQVNEYSKAAAVLLATMEQTAGADQLLDESRRMSKARRMFVSENVEALVTTDGVAQRSVVLEVTGHVSMAKECKRQPGGGGYIFMYDGLMKGTSGEDTGSTHELICVDTRKRGNDSKFCRRSCVPNCVLKHVLGSNATLGVMIVATKDIVFNQEVTLPFDLDWGNAEEPLICAEHIQNPLDCPFEKQRLIIAAERNKREREELAIIEREEREAEERRRLEDEVRRERAEATRKLEAEEERERREAAKKAKEEARKKKEAAAKAEKAAKRERQVSEERARRSGSFASVKSERTSVEPQHKLTRDERLIQQAEERFRRQEEAERRKEAAKAKAQEKAAAAAAALVAVAPVAEQLKQEVKEEKMEEERVVEKSRETPSRELSTSRSRRNTASARQSATRSSVPPTNNRTSKKRDSEMTTPRAPSAKRARTSTREREVPVGDHIGNAFYEAAVAVANHGRNDLNLEDTPTPSVFKGEEIARVEEIKKRAREVRSEERRRSTRKATKQVEQEEPMEQDGEEEVAPKEEVPSKEPTPAPVARQPSEVKEETIEAPAASEPSEVPEAPETLEAPRSPKEETLEASEAPEQVKEPIAAAVNAPVPDPAPAPAEAEDEPKAEPKVEPIADAPAPIAQEEPAPVAPAPEEPPAPSGAPTQTPPAAEEKAKGGKKKLSMADYKKRQSARASNTDDASANSTPAATRQGFIPSTEGSRDANISLTEINLQDKLNPASSSSAPSTATPVVAQPPPPSIPPPSEDEPAAHSQSLADRAALVFGLALPAAAPPARKVSPPPPPPPPHPSSSSTSSSHSSRSHDSRSRRASRWN